MQESNLNTSFLSTWLLYVVWCEYVMHIAHRCMHTCIWGVCMYLYVCVYMCVYVCVPSFTTSDLFMPAYFVQEGPVRVCVTGAAGQIAYSLLFALAKGDVFGPQQVRCVSLICRQLSCF